jgi:hypothetical protein
MAVVRRGLLGVRCWLLALCGALVGCAARVDGGPDASADGSIPGDGASVADASGRDVTAPPVDAPAPRGGRGAVCATDAQCDTGLLCATGPDLIHTCTIPCARDEQCMSGDRCAVDRPPGGAPRALCALVDPGTGEEGASCAQNNECVSNWCVDRVCRTFCGADAMCATGARCVPAPGLTGLRVCGFAPVTGATIEEFPVSEGMTTVDRPTERAFELAPDGVSWSLWVQDLEGRDLLASVVRVTAPDGAVWIDGNTWNIVREQTIRDILPQVQINTVLAPSSDTLRVLPGRYRYFAGLFNNRSLMTAVRTRRASVVLKVKRAPGGMLPATGNLRVRFYFAPGVGITGPMGMANPRIQAALTGMRQAYMTVGVTVTAAGYEDLPGADAARFTVIDSIAEMDELFTRRPAGRSDEVNVYFVRSIAASAGLGGAIGVAGDIVGPAGVHGTIQSGVMISLDGTLNGGGARDLLSNTLAHEVGHYLGLWHTREQQAPCTSPTQMDCAPFGGVDPISDTPTDNTGAARNTMYWSSSAGLLTFSAGQGRVVRSSVLVTH